MNTLTIPAFSAEAAEAAQRRLDNLAKVPRSLGRIEELAVRLAGITGKECPAFPEKSVVLFAADHDIALQGVSATGQEVTEMQVRNFVKGGGTINAFCRNAGARLSVVDVGVKNDLDDVEGLVRRKVMHAARDFSEGPAMTREEALACVQVGIDMAREEAARGVTLLAAGEMGIGNTSPSSAITAVLTGAPVEEVTGIGSGIPSAQVRHKAELIRYGIEINNPDPHDPLDVLAKGRRTGTRRHERADARRRGPAYSGSGGRFHRRCGGGHCHRPAPRYAGHAHRLAFVGGAGTPAPHAPPGHSHLF